MTYADFRAQVRQILSLNIPEEHIEGYIQDMDEEGALEFAYHEGLSPYDTLRDEDYEGDYVYALI